MTENWLVALNIVLWLSAAFVIGTLYATHEETRSPTYYWPATGRVIDA